MAAQECLLEEVIGGDIDLLPVFLEEEVDRGMSTICCWGEMGGIILKGALPSRLLSPKEAMTSFISSSSEE